MAATIIISILLLILVGVVIRKMIRNHKQGKRCSCQDCSSCNGSCSKK